MSSTHLNQRHLMTHVMDAGFNFVSWAVKPFLADRLDGVRVEKDIAYLPDSNSAHLLDIYHPPHAHGPVPAVFYIHGGGFSICSKDTHWVFGAEFARRGYLVVMPNYRLAPENKFPIPVQDVFAAWTWFVQNARRLGVDLSRVVVAGESAGANLSLGLTFATLEDRPEAYARPVFESGVVPKAVIAACGALDVTNMKPSEGQNIFVQSRIRNVRRGYVEGALVQNDKERELMDPLVALEGDKGFSRPFPPVFVPCGEKDPIVEDSTRLGNALSRRQIPHLMKLYPGEGHAFNAFVFRKQAQLCWEDQSAFLEQHGAGPTATRSA